MKTRSLNEFNFEHWEEWPIAFKCLVGVVLILLVLGLGYWFITQPDAHEYELLVQQEQYLRQQFEEQQQQAAHLQAYQQQFLMLQHRFAKMLKQLSKQKEMPKLLEDISKTGMQSGLTFELFAPQPEVAHDFYMELPIHLVVVGDYHQLAMFSSRISQMNRLVTLHDFIISPYGVAQNQTPSNASQVERSSERQGELLSMKMTLKVYGVRDSDRIHHFTGALTKENIV